MSIVDDFAGSRYANERLVREAKRLSNSPEYPRFTSPPDVETPRPSLALLVNLGVLSYDGETVGKGEGHVTLSSALKSALAFGAIDEVPALADQIRSIAFLN